MPTANYNLPTIAGTEVADFVGDLNALANATDAALKTVENAATTYVLPTATAYVKGGVKIGDGIDVADDGTISARLSTGEVVADSIAAGAVTTDKIAPGAVTTEKLAQSLATDVANGTLALSQANTALNAFNASPATAGSFSSDAGIIESWGKVVIVHAEQLPVSGSARTLVGTMGVGYRPSIETTVPVAATDGSGSNVVGFLKIDTGGNIYINPGGKSGLNWTGTAVYLMG